MRAREVTKSGSRGKKPAEFGAIFRNTKITKVMGAARVNKMSES
jgi:hypothetical protein